MSFVENYLWIGFIGAVLALLFAAIQRKKVMSYSDTDLGFYHLNLWNCLLAG